MKESFLAEAASLALEIAIPDKAALAGAAVNLQEQRSAGPGRLRAAAAKLAKGSRALAGSLVWSERDGGWVADRRLCHESRVVRWQVRGVSFDAAFRNALRGAAQVLSGNGQPR
jgi:hypothetical protein